MAEVHREPAAVTVLAPAKLNWTLEVISRGDDGYHQIRSVIQTIDLCDTIRLWPSQHVEIRSDMPGWVAEESLVSRAAALFREATGCVKGAEIEVTKRIPLVAGLGGDSSDAAATLRGLDRLWGLDMPDGKLHSLAAQLGSDVAFFLYGGTALIEGRGEKVTPLPSLSNQWLVLVVPAEPRLPGKTGRLYRSLESSQYTDGRRTERFIQMLNEGEEFDPSRLYNVFEGVCYQVSPAVGECRDKMLVAGAISVHLAGSGPTLYTLANSKAAAEELSLRLEQQGLETYITEA